MPGQQGTMLGIDWLLWKPHCFQVRGDISLLHTYLRHFAQHFSQSQTMKTHNGGKKGDTGVVYNEWRGNENANEDEYHLQSASASVTPHNAAKCQLPPTVCALSQAAPTCCVCALLQAAPHLCLLHCCQQHPPTVCTLLQAACRFQFPSNLLRWGFLSRCLEI